MGIRNGIAIAQAIELVQSAISKSGGSADSPMDSPVVDQHDPVADSIAIQRIADALQETICPMVAIESLGKRPWAGQSLSEPETLFCDLSGVAHLFGDEQGVFKAVHRCLGKLGYQAKLAIADGTAATWAHAHYNPCLDFISRSPVDAVQDLPVEALRIETETKYTLDRLGIHQIGTLLRFPRDGLAKRLGPGLVQRIAQLLGEQEDPLQFHHAQQQCKASHDLEYSTDDLEIIADRVSRLTNEIVASLAANQRGALRLVCRLDLNGRSQLSTVIGLFSPTLDQKHLTCLINSSIESLTISQPISRITLMVMQSGTLRTQQASLFSDQAIGVDDGSVSKRDLARLVDTLTGRLGREAVLGVRLSDNPLPEKAFRTYSLTDHRTRRALRILPTKQRVKHPREFQRPSRSDARRRPIELLRKPLPLSTMGSGDPGVIHDPMPTFHWQGQEYNVVQCWGPERIETGWWEGPTVRRDYYRIETKQGNLWWVFKDLRSNKWYLHGRFN